MPRSSLVPVAVLFSVLTSLVVGVAGSADAAPAGPVLDVTAAPYLAAGDGTTNDRVAIQRALDDAGARNATVLIPAGRTFLTGSLTIPSDTTLEVDGTLKQSQHAADYDYKPFFGHIAWPPDRDKCPYEGNPPSAMGGTCAIDDGFFHNRPLLYSGNSSNVVVQGTGTLQMTDTKVNGVYQDAATIDLMPIGFYRVRNYTVKDLHLVGAHSYNVAMFTTNNGVVENLTIRSDMTRATSTDGISIMNSQDLRITGNDIITGDDAMYVSSSYRDGRAFQHPDGGAIWWNSEQSQPSRRIEIDHNLIKTQSMGIGFYPWGVNNPDPSLVSISDINVHDNTVTGNRAAVGCGCDDPDHGGVLWHYSDRYGDQAPISNVRFLNNTFSSQRTDPFLATDLKTDLGIYGAREVLGGDFAKSGLGWWSAIGAAGHVGTTDAAHASALTSPPARAALRRMSGGVGYLQPTGAESVQLHQGISSPPIPGNVAPKSYQLRADVITGGSSFRLFAYDTCAKRYLATKNVDNRNLTAQTLAFQMTTDCDDVQVGIDHGARHAATGWALIDNVRLDSPATVTDNVDAAVSTSGSAGTYNAAGDWGGNHITMTAAGAKVSVQFTGTRGYWFGIKAPDTGFADVYVDGVQTATVDSYATTSQFQQLLYDTGTLPFGEHTVTFVETGTHRPGATNSNVVLDALVATGGRSQ